jgi:hypothetical protein
MFNDDNRLSYVGDYIDETFLRWFSQQDPATIDLQGRGLNHLFREAVKHQTVGLRRYMGIKKTISLDHYPVHFSTLKWIFLKLQGFNPCRFTRREITTEMLRDWQHFHGALAEYRLLGTGQNRFLGRCHSYHWQEAFLI